MKKDQAIKIFKEIRDLPYHISLNGELSQDCVDKSKLLSEKLGELGYEAKTVIGLFRWSNLNLPPEITAKPHVDDCSHMFVSAMNSIGEEVFIDPTWNCELKKGGFPVSEWDGEGSTELAVPCYQILTGSEAKEYLSRLDGEKDIIDNLEFYKAINEYCDGFLRKEI